MEIQYFNNLKTDQDGILNLKDYQYKCLMQILEKRLIIKTINIIKPIEKIRSEPEL